MDFRELSAITLRDFYPFPSVDSIMYHLGSASVFTTLDCSRGFLQIPIREEDIPKTAFTCYRGLYEFVRMPFGLTNSPATFQRLMDLVLGDARDVFAMAYMDDVVVFSDTFEEHIKHLRITLERMRDAGLTMNPGKVQLASSRVKLLGYVVENGRIQPNKGKLKAILEYPAPHNEKSLRRFLGMLGFYRQFIPNCAALSHPLNQLLRKGVRWHWRTIEQNAFVALRTAILTTTTLKLPDLNRPFVLQTDASSYGLGAVLLQEMNGTLRPIAFASHTMTPAERNYSAMEQECLAIFFALKMFDTYLNEATFTIQTDHQALVWLKN